MRTANNRGPLQQLWDCLKIERPFLRKIGVSGQALRESSGQIVSLRPFRAISFILLAAAIMATAAGCQTAESNSESTSEPLLQAELAYNCDVRQGFASSSSADVAAIKNSISDIDQQIKALQANITARQSDLAALQSTEKSAEMQRLENNIQSLQEQIAALQNQLKELQMELQALQKTEKSAEMISLENEIKSMQVQMASLQDTLAALQRDLRAASDTGQSMVGFLESIKIGDIVLAEDFTVIDPITSNQMSVAGVVSQIYWNGNYAEPIFFSCQISEKNKTQLAVLLNTTLSNTNVAFAFTIYDYDPDAKSYFKSFHTNSVQLRGLVHKSGGEFVMSLDFDPSAEVTNPRNYTFVLGVTPQAAEQDVHLAVSSTDKLVKVWGTAVGE